MKKIAVAITMILLISLCGCTTKLLSIEQSKNNFAVYENSIQEIAVKHGFELREEFDENIEDQECYKDLLIVISEDSEIFIRMINSAYDSSDGAESFDVRYTINPNETKKETFDEEFFVEIVNAISGKTISKKFCQEFLDAPEEKYSPSRYGISKSENQKIFKYEFLNFWEDWSIAYKLDTDMIETLSFWGLTKQLTN